MQKICAIIKIFTLRQKIPKTPPPPCSAPSCHASVGGGVPDAPPLTAAPPLIPCRAAPMCAAARHALHPQRRGTLAPPYSRFTNSAPHVAHRTIKPCHCEERSDVAIRTPFAPHLRPMRRGRVLPRPIRRPLPVIPCRAAPMCAAARHALHPQRRGTLAPPYRHFTNSIGNDAHIVPSARHPQ